MEQKEYILALKAQLQDMASSGLITLNKRVDSVGTTAESAGKKTQTMGDVIEKSMARALLVAPIWMALRSVMVLAVQTTQEMIKANMDLEDNMAKIGTGLRGTTTEIAGQMGAIKAIILDTATSSDKSLKELSDAYHQLDEVLGNTQLAMAGFKSTEVLMTTTGLSAIEAGKIMARTYNEIGATMDKNLSPAEKFQKISDTLIYTSKTQGVEVGNLIQGYSKLAPFLTGSNDKFEDIITTLGFLNTHFVEGGRAGQSLSQEIVNLGKNAKELANVFNIQLNPNQPLSIINTFTQLKDKIKDTTKLDVAQSEALSKIFGGARTSAPSREILTFFDELIAKIKDTEENATNFGAKVKEAISGTTSYQLKELSNNIAVVANDFATGATAGNGFVQYLKEINEVLKTSRPLVTALGNDWGYFIEVLQRGTVVGQIYSMLGALSGGGSALGAIKDIRSYQEFLADREKANVKALATTNTLKTLEEAKSERATIDLNTEKERVEYQKELGSLLQAMGADESQILAIKMQQLEIDHNSMTNENYLLEMGKLRYQQIVAIVKEREKEELKQASFAMQYQKASETERAQLRDMMELRNRPATELASLFETSTYANALILKYWSNFTKEGQIAVGKVMTEHYDLPQGSLGGIEKLPEDEINTLKIGMKDNAIVFWDSWDSRKKESLDNFARDFTRMGSLVGVESIGGGGGVMKERMAIDQKIDMSTKIEKIEVILPANALTQVAEEAGKAVTKALTTNEELQRKLAKKLSPLI